MPVHFGGMSDPFQPAEEKFRVSLGFLSVLSEFQYPTVISTRSSLVMQEPYINLLQRMPVLVQFSLSTIDDQQAKVLEPLAPKPSLVLKTMRELSNSGVRVAARWQPYALHLSSSPDETVSAVAEAGAKHLSLEHLKIPTELDLGTKGGQALAALRQIYKEQAAYRDGREFVLPSAIKLPTVLKVRALCHEHGMTFGAGDNDLQVLSDGNACCAGIDVAGGLDTFYEYTMTNIIKRQLRTGTEIKLHDYGSWRPKSALDRFLNSKSRLKGKVDPGDRGVEAFLRHRWNGHSLNASPAIAYGISRTGERDQNGNEVYLASDELRLLLSS